MLTALAAAATTARLRAAPNTSTTDTDLFEMSLEDLMNVRIDSVSTVSKYTQNLREAPASVTIITADEIRRYGYRTLAEILQSAPGFYLNYDRDYHYLGVRGFRRPGDYDTRILLLLDGHRINENVGDQLPSGTQFPLDVDLIDRVEIMRGAWSALYGSNALLAVINVIPKRGRDVRGVELSGEVATADTYQGRVTYGDLLGKKAELLVSGTAYESGGRTLYFQEFDTPATNDGRVDHDGDRFQNVAALASWGDLSLLLAHTGREKEVPTAPWETVFGDPRTHTWDATTLVGLTYSRQVVEEWTVKSRLVYGQYDYHGTWPVDFAGEGEDPNIIVSGDSWNGRWLEGELQVVGRPTRRHTLTAGIDSRYDLRQEQRTWDTEAVYLDDARYGMTWGVYFQDEFRLLPNLAFVAGARYDAYESFGSTTNPRLAAIYDLFADTTFKLIYGTAFRAPNVYELYYQDGGVTQKPSLHLEPETITTYEAVVEQQFNRALRGTVTGFYYVMNDLIDQYLDPNDGLLVFRNLEEVEARGVEVALEGRWDAGWRSRISYTYADARDAATDATLVDSPQHLAKFNLIVPLVREQLFAGGEVLYDSPSQTLGGAHADDFVLTNLTLTYVSRSQRLEVSAGIYNLLDTDYAYPGFGEHVQDALEQDGRALRVKLTYRF
jgi:iron complex outermembrane receptor protein